MKDVIKLNAYSDSNSSFFTKLTGFNKLQLKRIQTEFSTNLLQYSNELNSLT
jgi:hypothetical protein